MAPVTQRSEILFLYDATDANPNGDPLDENKPRIDEETGHNVVTDVRLKRTVRDYLDQVKGVTIFVRGELNDKGDLRTKEEVLDRLGGSPEDILSQCVDLRLFGATIAIKGRSVILTGPVQFRLGRSLHRVDLTFIKGTTVMPSREARGQGTMTEEYRLPYSLIAFYGVINENAAALHRQARLNREIFLTEEDVTLMLEGLWRGTQHLISRSKFGQMPRLLLRVRYRAGDPFFLGELDHRVRLQTNGLAGDAIRQAGQVRLDVTGLRAALVQHREHIEQIDYCHDPTLALTLGEAPLAGVADLAPEGVRVAELRF
jgi:CRISPR-associated protein Csh2